MKKVMMLFFVVLSSYAYGSYKNVVTSYLQKYQQLLKQEETLLEQEKLQQDYRLLLYREQQERTWIINEEERIIDGCYLKTFKKMMLIWCDELLNM